MKSVLAFLVLCLGLGVSATAQSVPSDARLADASLGYTTTVDIMGQQLVIPATRSIVRLDDRWRVVDVATMPEIAGGGTAVDTFEVATGSLLPLRRSATSMMGTMQLAYDGNSVEGQVASMMGGTVDLGKTFEEDVVLGDGAAFELFLSGLPLDESFDETFAIYTPQMQALRPTQVRVTGTETITTPAGTFETFVLDYAPQDGNPAGTTTFYVTKAAPHLTVKAVSDLGPEAGNGTATVELMSKQ